MQRGRPVGGEAEELSSKSPPPAHNRSSTAPSRRNSRSSTGSFTLSDRISAARGGRRWPLAALQRQCGAPAGRERLLGAHRGRPTWPTQLRRWPTQSASWGVSSLNSSASWRQQRARVLAPSRPASRLPGCDCLCSRIRLSPFVGKAPTGSARSGSSPAARRGSHRGRRPAPPACPGGNPQRVPGRRSHRTRTWLMTTARRISRRVLRP